MSISSRSSMIALSLRSILWIVFLIMTVSGLSEGPRILVVGVALFVYVLAGDILKLFINIYSSPEWLELSNNVLVIKPRFKNSFSINVNEVTRIAEASWIKLIASYNKKIVCSERKLTLYLGEAEFVGLNEFLIELKKANPTCEVDEYLNS